ncbi:MAG: hypothetical protein M1831_003654 [Alyxoria varia]|nr:MAG: hypothetical protein M1831_003654 [Alyxoria varia]
MPIEPRSLAFFAAGAAVASATSLIWTVRASKQAPSNATPPPPLDLSAYPASSSSALPYPPSDFIEGQRDVSTPYGSIRVYEFGPRDSKRKVLFLHGVRSPCITLVPLAEGLASRGCRVMLLDLFGHGWSGGPTDLPYDSRLYTTQIFMALASSPISWTGAHAHGGRFSIIGASLGGGLAADFASYFPQLVDDLVLLVPGGLTRGKHISWKSKVLYPEGWLPESFREWLVGRRLNNQIESIVVSRECDENTGEVIENDTQIDAGSGIDLAAGPTESQQKNQLDIGRTMAWQSDHHPGFLRSFMSTICHSPITDQHPRWSVLGSRLSVHKPPSGTAENSSSSMSGSPLRSGKVLMILGAKDTLIPNDEVIADARTTLGESNVDIQILEGGGHDLFYAMSKPVLDLIWKAWESS